MYFWTRNPNFEVRSSILQRKWSKNVIYCLKNWRFSTEEFNEIWWYVSPQMQGEGTCGHRNSQIFQRGKASPFDPRCHCVDVAGCVWWGIRARQLVTFFPYLWRHLSRAIPKAQRRHRGEILDLCIFLYFLKRNPIFVFRKCVRVSTYFKSAIKPFAV